MVHNYINGNYMKIDLNEIAKLSGIKINESVNESIIAQHRDLIVHEVSSGYEIENTTTGETHGMGDGVDQFEGIDAGTPEFNKAMQNDLEHSYDEIMDAYFAKEEGVDKEILKNRVDNIGKSDALARLFGKLLTWGGGDAQGEAEQYITDYIKEVIDNAHDDELLTIKDIMDAYFSKEVGLELGHDVDCDTLKNRVDNIGKSDVLARLFGKLLTWGAQGEAEQYITDYIKEVIDNAHDDELLTIKDIMDEVSGVSESMMHERKLSDEKRVALAK